MASKNSYATPDGLQRVSLVSVAVAYGVGLVQTIQLFYQHAMTNPNFSGIWPMLLWQAIPLAFFALAYFLNPRKKLTTVQRLFEAVVITFIGLALFVVLSQASSYLVNATSFIGYESFMIYEISIMAVMVVGFAGVLWFLARTKRWK